MGFRVSLPRQPQCNAQPNDCEAAETLRSGGAYRLGCLQLTRLCSPTYRWPPKEPDDDEAVHDGISGDLQPVRQP